MKKLFFIILLSIFVSKSTFAKTIGEGELKLDDSILEYFWQYIKGKGNKKPGTFVIAIDGSYATYWYCPESRCAASAEKEYVKICEIDAKIECKVFARSRTIKWKNGINPGKGKISKINSRQSYDEFKNQMTQLGFYGNNLTIKKEKIEKKESKKTVKKIDASGSSDLTEQLKTLNELYKSGALTKEEFTKAKKKLLN